MKPLYWIFLLVIMIFISGCSKQIDNLNNKTSGSIYEQEVKVENNYINESIQESISRNNEFRSNKTLREYMEEKPLIQIHTEVWSQHSPAEESWEFKVNCFGNYSKLEECFLWDLDLVRVITPNNSIYDLNKDFNINNYSGEVTRRWVLYGPAKAELPESGIYRFEYIKNESVVYTQTVNYTKSKVSYPNQIRWERKGNDLNVDWMPPTGIDSTMNYKVIIWNEYGTPSVFVSKAFQWNATNGILENVPLIDGGNYSLNVAIFFRDGYAYSEYINFTWN